MNHNDAWLLLLASLFAYVLHCIYRLLHLAFVEGLIPLMKAKASLTRTVEAMTIANRPPQVTVLIERGNEMATAARQPECTRCARAGKLHPATVILCTHCANARK